MSFEKLYNDFEEEEEEVYNVYCAYDNKGNCIGEADTLRDVFRLYGTEDIFYITNCDDVYIDGGYVDTINEKIVCVRGD